MNIDLLDQIHQLNPWLKDPSYPALNIDNYIPRKQAAELMLPDWDSLWTIIVGPRQAGKTTLGKYICHELLTQRRFDQLLYLNCDILSIREWLSTPLFLKEAFNHLALKKPIIFIDEVQRLESPGLLLKIIADLKLPIKMLASGSSQLEIKSKVQEHLTGRHIESLVLPLSYSEIPKTETATSTVIFGCYPQIIQEEKKAILLKQLYQDYITKDIIGFMKLGKPDTLESLLALIAHGSGQLVNYNQLATDCRISTPTVQHYLSILEKTYIIESLKPFVGNKRTEITANPMYYFIDNGFRNQALGNFAELDHRVDTGLLIESAVFQEIIKFKAQTFRDFSIHFWRTKSGAEVDFVLRQRDDTIFPIEVKYRLTQSAAISRGYRSFIDAYQPKQGLYITKSFVGEKLVDGCLVRFIPFKMLDDALALIASVIK